jgi:hypothetical protein
VVAQLPEINLSPLFGGVFKRLSPDYRAARDWRRPHGARLHGHDFTGRA